MRKNKQSPVAFAKKPAVVATQVALAVMAQFAYAQQQVAERVERVEITGTRLPQLSTEGASPVTVMDAQEIRMDGQAKTEDLLNSLPQVYAAQGSYASNGSTGTATVNLRNLGETRNLVLLNGRRMPAGSPRKGNASVAADLNQIPAPLIQRVELLTGGASAVYGSDAITGVVNFIMNDRFEGLQLDVYHSFFNHSQQNPNGIADIVAARARTNPSNFAVPGDVGSDGAVNSFSMLMGKNFADNKGNATAYLQYRKEDAVLQASRDFSACSLRPGATFTCGGSGTSATGQFISGLGAADPGNVFTIADAAGNTRPFVTADQFNFGPANYYRRPSEQYAAAAFAHLDLTPRVRAYTEIGFHDNRSLAQIAPSGSFFTQQTISWDNPLLSAAEKNAIAAGLASPATFSGPGNTTDILVARRNIEGGGRVDDIRHTSYRGLAGAKGEIAPGFTYDAFAQTSRVLYQNVYRNDFSITRIGRALDVISVGGVPTCRSAATVAQGGTGTDPNCVPWNIWAIGGVNQAALNYLQTPGLQNGETRMHVLNGTIQADLGSRGVKLPSARDGLAVAFGVERRKEALTLQTDTQFETNDLAGQGSATPSVSGKLDVDEWFTEARLPLAQRVPMADLLSINGSYRRSNYSTGISTNTYGLGAEWAPVRAYRLRGSYSHAIRHANINELFQPQSGNLVALVDPCAGAAPTATAAQCARSGVTTQYGSILANPAGQYNVLQGGNPALKPETANTYTIGLVMNPLRSLTATFDWWDIKIDDAVGTAPAQTILNQCINSGQFCNLVQRDSLGTLWLTANGRIVTTNQNLGGYHTSGLDVGINWSTRMGANGFGVNFLGTYVSKWEFEPIKGLGKFDCAGFVGQQCGTPNPVWRHKMRGTWATPWNVDLALTWRHIDKVKNETTSSDPLLSAPTAATDRELAARDYFDLAGIWTINKTFSLRAGVNNLFDKDPPIVSGTATAAFPALADPSIFGNGNTFPQVYDTLGRMIFMNLTMKF